MSEKKFAFDRVNYLIMIGGIVILFLGFFIMTLDKETYGFGFLGLTLGPIVVMLGFLTQFVAILYKPKAKPENTAD
ncbi:MAG: DUF3098 domain-containing protein [Cyclobacteriaceae bacterium]|nr:DUF3098 domain-containing protein [Cyclobacteriaceae bacterium HetDA_MAG_MS6]